MSTAAGLAAVTAVLKDLLMNGLIAQNAATAVGDVAVSTLPPDRIAIPEQTSQLNLFLYLVTPNQGWRNVDLPSRDSDGNLITNPPLALDLHYLLTAYGAKDFHAEILLGYGMQLLHEMPVLSRAAIRQALAPSDPVAGGSGQLPPDLQDLFQSGIADQIEMVKITPAYFNTDEMFKLWMAFQAAYRPTAAYNVSVILIESATQGQAPLPVRATTVTTMPFQQPVIATVLSQAASGQPWLNQPILAGYNLQVNGQNLQGQVTSILVGGVELDPPAITVQPTQITFALPNTLLAGIIGLQVVQKINMGAGNLPHNGTQSDTYTFPLQPSIKPPTVNITTGEGGPDTIPRVGQFTVTTNSPRIGVSQQVALLLSELNPPSTRAARSYTLNAASWADAPSPPATSQTVTVPFTNVLPATYVARLQVDGAQSPMTTDANGMYNGPQVQIT